MDFVAFKRQLLDAIIRIQQTQIAATVASVALAEFPSNLPEQMRTRFEKTLEDLGKELERVLDQRTGYGDAVIGKSVYLEDEGDPIGFASVAMLMANVTATGSMKVNLSTTLFTQSLVTGLAQVDGFVNDCVRAACRR